MVRLSWLCAAGYWHGYFCTLFLSLDSPDDRPEAVPVDKGRDPLVKEPCVIASAVSPYNLSLASI